MTRDCQRDAELVDKIVAELKRDGTLNDPRQPEYPATLEYYASAEVQRSLDRVRLLQTWEPPAHVPPTPTAADYRAVARKLRKIKDTKELRKVGVDTLLEKLACQLEAVEQEPPEGVNAPKYLCAAEAYYLMMDMFSAKAPTGTPGGPFQTIAALLYEGVTGKAGGSMKRACKWVLESRGRFSQRLKPSPRARSARRARSPAATSH